MTSSSKRSQSSASASQATQAQHPNVALAAIFGDDAQKYVDLMAQPLSREIFDIWAAWLRAIMRDKDVSPEVDFPILYAGLQARRITNHGFVEACETIEGSLRSFPHLSDFLKALGMTEAPGRRA